MKDSLGIDTRIDKRDFNGDPSLLLEVEQLRPLAAFPFATRPILDCLRSLGHGWYVVVGPRPFFLDDGLPADTLRVVMVVWARDLAEALLAARREDMAVPQPDETPNPLPPVDMLVPSKGWSYGELVKAGRGKVMEGAIYDGTDGMFRYKELRFPKVSVCFRSRRRKNSEFPFAMSIVGPKPWWVGENGKTKGRECSVGGEKVSGAFHPSIKGS